MFMIFPIFGGVGFVVIAILVKYVDPQKLLVWVLIFGVATSAAIIAILMFQWPSLLFIITHFFYIIPSTCVWSLTAVVTLSNFPSETRSFVMGLCAACKNIGAILSPFLSGLLMDQTTTEIGFSALNFAGKVFALVAALMLPMKK